MTYTRPGPLCVSAAALLAGFCLFPILARAGAAKRFRPADLETIDKILSLPEREIDLAMVKLTIDRMIDPSIDIAANLKQLDRMVAEIGARLPAPASSRDKLDALRARIYQPGPWNDHRPFEYDLDDPFGSSIHNKLLPTYLATRKGNCVSMPMLFIILGQRLGINVTASRAPGHIFVKYRDETGEWFNIEATSGGGFSRDAWIRKQIPMTSQALSSGIYLQPMTKGETAVAVLSTLMEFYQGQGWYDGIIPLATLALAHHPRSVSSMVFLAAAYAAIWDRDCIDRYPHAAALSDLPHAQRAHCAELNQNAWFWRSKAEALGWRQPTAVANEEYLQRATQQRAARRGIRREALRKSP